MPDWKEILNEIKGLKAEEPITSEEMPSEPIPVETLDTEKKWWQIADILSRNDELLQAILEQLQSMSGLLSQPSTPPEYPELPSIPGIEAKLDSIALEQIRTRQLLEGFSFTTGQANVQTPGTPIEVISTVKTYLIVIRANIANTGSIYIGGRGVSANNGFVLDAGEALSIQIDNLKKTVWVDSQVANEGVSWMALVD